MKWFAVIAIPLAAVAFDTRLNTELFSKNYRIGEIKSELKSLSETLDGLRVEEANLLTQEHTEVEGSGIGLVPPQPDQITVIYYTERDNYPVEEPVPFVFVERDRGYAAVPCRSFTLGAADGASPGSGEEKSWDTSLHFIQASSTSMGDLLRKAVYSACASYRGGS
jgi:hypothetical protein